ncbi:alpha/beta fold hydrolase [Brachybacterium squillarum]|uniref:alpha/beta fold hydrolase n=1 Tax=Brachybacterium squillarum TaxID=661979 RepID=UPI0002629908|nr:alpha/beta hydrolase [Brachybacterium squillarum]
MSEPAVVLVHGTRTSSRQWDPQVPGLRAAGYRVIAPDLPGHGTRTAEPFTLRAAADAIAEAVASAGYRPTHLVGTSLGGMLAIHVAANRTLPQLVSLIAAGAAVQPGPRSAALYGKMLAGLDRAPRTRHAHLLGARSGPEVIAPAMRAVAALDLRADLARIDVPVIILSPRFDQLRVQERAFAAAAPQGRLEVLPYGTHLVNLSRPRRFTRDLVRLLGELDRERALSRDPRRGP